MVYFEDLRKHFKKEDIITVVKVVEKFKIAYPSAKILIIENEVKGIVKRTEVGTANSKRQTYVWQLV